MPDRQVVLYATADCPHCAAARAALASAGQPFEERDPLENVARLKELMLLSARAAVPTIVVGRKVLVGFDAVRLDEMLHEPLPEPEPEPADDEIDDLEEA